MLDITQVGGTFPSVAAVDTLYQSISIDTLTTYNVLGQWTNPLPYGSYYYCNMPHPHPNYYECVPDGQLEYVEYVQRHHRRTPYNILPGDDFTCTNGRLVGMQLDALYTTVDLKMSDLPNIFAEANGTCQFPQLTQKGVVDAYTHGKDLRGVYGEIANLLPYISSDDVVRFRASNAELTEETASSLIQGLYGSQSIPLYQQPALWDSVNSGFSCQRRDQAKQKQRDTSEWAAHLSAMKEVVASLNTTGFTTGFTRYSGFPGDDFNGLCDNFQAKVCNDVALTVANQLSSSVFNAGDWEYNYSWRQGPAWRDYVTATEGVFINEILGRLESPGKLKYHHTFAHDNDLAPLAAALGIDYLRWPGMGSNVAIEIWNVDGAKLVRVLYCGSPIRSRTLGNSTVPVQTLIDQLRNFTLTQKEWCDEEIP